MSSKNRINARKSGGKPPFTQKQELPVNVSPENGRFTLTSRRKALIVVSILLLTAGFASLRGADAPAGNINSYFSIIALVSGYFFLLLSFFA